MKNNGCSFKKMTRESLETSVKDFKHQEKNTNLK